MWEVTPLIDNTTCQTNLFLEVVFRHLFVVDNAADVTPCPIWDAQGRLLSRQTGGNDPRPTAFATEKMSTIHLYVRVA